MLPSSLRNIRNSVGHTIANFGKNQAMIIFLIDADKLPSPGRNDEVCQVLEALESGITIRRAYGSSESLKGPSAVLSA